MRLGGELYAYFEEWLRGTSEVGHSEVIEHWRGQQGK